MAQNRLSAEMPDTVKQQILDHLNQAKTLAAPYIVTLKAEERRKMRKMGPDSVSYVQLNYEGYRTFPGIYPIDFEGSEFERDVKLFAPLSEIATVSTELAQNLSDSAMVAGSEAMAKADESYELLKGRARRDGKVKAFTDRVGLRFAGQGRRRKSDTGTPA